MSEASSHTQAPTWARRQAYRVIRRVSSGQAYARPVIDALIRTADVSESERDFASLLCLGTIAAAGELDLIINRSIESKRISGGLRDLLRLASYELVFLGKQPYAAISQAVALARSLYPRMAGFVNWALHRILEDSEGFPWGDPETDLEALAHAQAFPLWMAERLVAELGWLDASAFMRFANQAPPTFAQDLRSGQAYKVEPSGFADLQQSLDAGTAIIADLATQEVSRLVADQVGEGCSLLEVGSGRGTKTVLIARQQQRSGAGSYQHFAIDIHEFKTSALLDRVGLYGLAGVEALTADVFELPALAADGRLPSGFDLVFIDAPCSGSGTLRRHPEARWRLQETAVSELARQGMAFLEVVAPFVQPGGALLYSTCSLFREENEAVVEGFQASVNGSAFQLMPLAVGTGASMYFHSWQRNGGGGDVGGDGDDGDGGGGAGGGGDGGDAHFAALLRRVTGRV